MGGTSKVLTRDEIIAINYRQIERFGGVYFADNDNLLNPGTLESVLAACQGSLFGVDRYPTPIDKAAKGSIKEHFPQATKVAFVTVAEGFSPAGSARRLKPRARDTKPACAGSV
jgi:hypothetical protein